jgi:glycosyltransferase involved in cell wall biosynthesis
MSKKNIAVFIPSIESGGVEKNLFLITNFLSSKMDHITLITCDNYDFKFANINIIRPKFKFISKLSRKMKYLICLILLISQILKKKKLLIFSFQANFYATIITKIFNQKIIIRSNSSPTGWSNSIIRNILFKFLYKLPDHVIVNSQDFKKELKKKFNRSAHVIYNPLNKKEIKILSKKKINFKFFKDKKYFRVMSMGRLVDQKDFITFLNAIKIVKKKIKIRVLLMGSGILKDKLKKFIKFNKLESSIKLINFQKNPYKYLKFADIFVLTSKFEGLPNVLLESATLKIPIISTDCNTGPREILNGNKGGLLFKVGDYNQLAKQILASKLNYKMMKNKINFTHKNLDRFDEKTNLLKYLRIIKYSLNSY